jgi:hypothetical protein
MQEFRGGPQHRAVCNGNGDIPAKVVADTRDCGKELLVNRRLRVTDTPSRLVRQPSRAAGFRVGCSMPPTAIP